MTDTQAKDPPKQSIVDSLTSENTILHRQLDQANAKAQELETKLKEIEQQLAESEAAKTRAEERIATLQKQLKPDKKIEVRIEDDTLSFDIEKLLGQGWINLYMQFSNEGILRTVWKRENELEADSPEDEAMVDVNESDADEHDSDDDGAVEILPTLDIEVIADEIFKPLPDDEPMPQPVNAQGKPLEIDVISDIPRPRLISLGPIGFALQKHGLEKTKEAMDAMVQLRVAEAMREYEPPGIKQFQPMLPAEVQS